MRFADIPGQDSAKDTLRYAVADGRVPHALILRGAPGIGKLPLAWAFAQYLNCTQPSDGDSCGTCPNCRKTADLVHPDLHLVAPIFLATGKSSSTDDHIESLRNTWKTGHYASLTQWGDTLSAENKQLVIAIHEMRQLRHKLGLRAYGGGYKVVIIWHAEKVNLEAANAFLKLLEEPPDKTILLLTVESPAQLLPTLTSRCQPLPVSRVPVVAIQTYLEQKGESPERAEELAWLAEGSVGRALTIAAHAEEGLFEQYQTWLRMAYGGKLQEILPWAEQAGRQPKEATKLLLEYTLGRLHDVVALLAGADALVRLPAQHRLFLQRMAPTLDFQAVEQMAKRLETALFHIQRNAHGPLTLLNLTLDMHTAFRGATTRAA